MQPDTAKDKLRAEFSALGIDYDGRWNEVTLRDELEKARKSMTKTLEDGMVIVRITKYALSEDEKTGKRPAKISNGEGGFAGVGDELIVSLKTGQALEARGYGEIQDDLSAK